MWARQSTRLSCSIGLMLIVSSQSVTLADDEIGWPFVRGAEFNNHSAETGLADSWPEQGPPVLWTRPLGTGYSSFSAQGGRVFTQYQSLGGQYVICLDAETGRTVWEYRYDWPYDPTGMYPGPRATPTLADGRVYFSGTNGLVGCLTADSGRLLWSVNLFERFKVKPVEFGYSCSPTVFQDKVLLPAGAPGASMVALNAKNGKTIWQTGDDPISHVPAFPIEFRGRWLVIGYLQNVLAAYDLETGAEVWTHSLSGGYDEHAAWPIYSEPYLWLAAPFRSGCRLLNLERGDSQALPEVWRNQLMSNDVCSSVLVDGFLYGFDLRDQQAKPHRPSRGAFRCLEFATGTERWSNGSANERRRLDEESDQEPNERPIGHASVLYADGMLILFNDTGDLILARANPDRFEMLGRIRVLGGEICWVQPMLYRRHLFLRNASQVVCLYLGRKEQLKPGAQQPTLTVADIPQSTYRDWAAIVLAVEPEFAMDAPTLDWLQRWFWVSLGCGLVSVLLAGSICGCTWAIKKKAPSPQMFWWVMWSLALSIGALGTTFLSGWTQQFIFTWPLCLFVGIQAMTHYTRMPRSTEKPNVWAARFVLIGFLAICLVYYLMCRRLSLAFNWVFLAGFPAAIPFLVWARWFDWRPRVRPFVEAALGVAGFAAFYWMSVAVLIWKYHS